MAFQTSNVPFSGALRETIIVTVAGTNVTKESLKGLFCFRMFTSPDISILGAIMIIHLDVRHVRKNTSFGVGRKCQRKEGSQYVESSRHLSD